jgi:4-alpha-glucanotransferase
VTEKAIAEGIERREVAGLYGVTWDGARALDPVPERAVASLNTRDTPTFAGFWRGADLDDRIDRGLLTEAQAHDERRGRGVSTAQLARSLARTRAAECAGHLARTAQLVTQDTLFLEAGPRVRRPGRNAGGDRQSA